MNYSTKSNWTTVAPPFSRKILLVNSSETIICFRFAAFAVSVATMSLLCSARRLKDALYKYLLVMASSDAAYSLLVFLLSWVTRMCYADEPAYCPASVFYAVLVLYVAVSEYLSSCLALFSIVLECFLTVQRILLVANTGTALQQRPLVARIRRALTAPPSVSCVCAWLFAVSLAAYLPVLFMRRIQTVTLSGAAFDYRLEKTLFGQSYAAKSLITGIKIARILLVTVVLAILNAVNIVQFNAYTKRKLVLKRISCKL